MRLLVVEDDIPIQHFLKRALVEAGYQVDTASTAQAGETMALEGIHDAFVIGLGLPDLDGLDLIARCRAHGNAAPVLILSARRSVDEQKPEQPCCSGLSFRPMFQAVRASTKCWQTEVSTL
jgi:two-component system, OmpR family, response regulator